MRKAGLLGLLWMFLGLEVQAATDPDEERYDLVEGQTLTVGCPFNIMKYSSSRKAWQRLPDGKEPLTLVATEKSSAKPSEVHMGKYTLKDGEAMLHVQMTDVRVTDSGLYRCVIYRPPNDHVLLFHPVRLVVTKENMHRDTAMTQPLPKSTDVVSSPDPGVTFTNATNVPRVSTSSIVVPVVCGLFSKTLVFTVLFAVTQKSFG